jgi:hypothetical protein
MTSSTEIIPSPVAPLQLAPLFTPTPKTAKRVLEFFTAQNQQRPHTQVEKPQRGAARTRRVAATHWSTGWRFAPSY